MLTYADICWHMQERLGVKHEYRCCTCALRAVPCLPGLVKQQQSSCKAVVQSSKVLRGVACLLLRVVRVHQGEQLLREVLPVRRRARYSNNSNNFCEKSTPRSPRSPHSSHFTALTSTKLQMLPCLRRRARCSVYWPY